MNTGNDTNEINQGLESFGRAAEMMTGTELGKITAVAGEKANKEFEKLKNKPQSEEAESVRIDLYNKHLINEFATVFYNKTSGFQPTRARYWADVAVKAVAGFVVLGAAGATVVAIAKRNTTADNEEATGTGFQDPFNVDSKTAMKERPRKDHSHVASAAI